MLVDLHNHSIFSHDGFSSESEIIAACAIRGISAIAITEHDEVCRLSPDNFRKSGIELIPGREYTTDRGAHIVGLFVTQPVPFGMNREDIVKDIQRQGGLILMPHPWKRGSGYMTLYKEDDFIRNFEFIELLNGGWNSNDFISEITRLSKFYSLRMVSSSDSHRGCQVGLCVTKIKEVEPFKVGDVKVILESVRQADIEFLMDRKMLLTKGRKTRKFQISSIYQSILPLIPERVKRYLKVLQYRLSKDGSSSLPDFTLFEEWNND
jgi:predicted metal-dependent phosphoesterase TrpH